MTDRNNARADPDADSTTFTQKVLASAGIIGGLTFLVLLVFYTIDIFLLLFAGILLAIFLHALGAWLVRLVKMPPSWSLCLAGILIMSVFGCLFWLLAPVISGQVQQLRTELPRALLNAKAYIEEIMPLDRLMEKIPPLRELIYGKAGPGLFTQIAGFFSNTLTIIANIIIILFAGLYLALEPGIYVNGVIKLIAPVRRKRAREVLYSVGLTLRWWLIGTLLDMLIVGLLTGIGLRIIGIQHALLLGILTASLTFIPYIGPALSAAPALLLAFIQGPGVLVSVIFLFVAVQTIEGYLTAPLIQQKTVLLPPVLTLMVQIVFGTFFGFLGLMLATPLAAAGLVLVKKIYIEDVLGDTDAVS